MYPLSGGYRDRLRELLGAEPTYLTLSDLRRLPLADLVRQLRADRGGRWFLPVEDDSSEAVIPMLHVVSTLSWPRELAVLTPELDVRHLSRAGAARALSQIAWSSLQGQRALRDARADLASLSDAPRIRVEPSSGCGILYLNGNLWFGLKVGGSVGHVAGVVNGFTTAGYDVDLLTASEPILIGADVAVRALRPAPLGIPLEVNYYRFSQYTAGQAAAIADRARHRFIYQRLSIGSYAGVAGSRATGLPLVLEYNGSEVWAARHWGRPLRHESDAQAAEDVSLRHAHLVVTVSKVLQDELLERGVEPERIVTHPNGVDVDRFDPGVFSTDELTELRRRYGLRDDDVVASFLGTFGQWHGAEVLGEAIARIWRQRRDWAVARRLQFLFIGDGLTAAATRELVAAAGADEIVRFAGVVPQDSAARYLAASDVLISPHVPNPDGSPFFGSPTKLFEYMSSGKAIVASELDQIGSVLSPSLGVGGDSGRSDALAILVTPGDVDELVEGIARAVDDRDLRTMLGANARRRAGERYTWRHHVDAILTGLARAVDTGHTK